MNSALLPLDLALRNTSYAAEGFKPSTAEDQAEAAATLKQVGTGALVFSAAWTATAVVGFGLAMAKSYKRNESLPWAFGSGLVWPAYLIYVYAIDKN